MSHVFGVSENKQDELAESLVWTWDTILFAVAELFDKYGISNGAGNHTEDDVLWFIESDKVIVMDIVCK